MTSTRPYRFEGIPRYTKSELAVSESLGFYLSQSPFREGFAKDLAQKLEVYLKSPLELAEPDFKSFSKEKIEKLLPEVGCLIVVGASPTEHKIIVDLDMGLANFTIDRLLGGDGEVGRIKRPLTEIEEGVISFIILKVIDHFQIGWETGSELSLSLDRFGSNLEELAPYIGDETGYHALNIRLAVGKKRGSVRVFLPNGIITQTFSSTPQSGANSYEIQEMARNLDAIGDYSVPVRLEATHLDLSADDILDLETGDIILLENHQLSLNHDGVTGGVFLRFGTGKNGGIQGQVIVDHGLTKVQLNQIIIQEHPQETPMVDDQMPVDEFSEDAEIPQENIEEAVVESNEEGVQAIDNSPNLPETEGLLRDVPAPVVVELGRLQMNISQVARLRQGQILRLTRNPTDPVDLVVHDKVFARGELIEVDGELGVRLVQLVGERRK